MKNTSHWLEVNLEEYAKNNLSELFACLLSSSNPEHHLIGTQIKCAYGRIDMLAWSGRYLFVIEFKAVNAGEKELGQVVRYSNLLESIIDIHQHLSDKSFGFVGDAHFRVCPVLVAPSFDNKLSSSNCILIQTKSDDGISFSFENYSTDDGRLFFDSNKDLKIVLADFERYVAGLAIGDVFIKSIGSIESMRAFDSRFNPPF